MPICVGDVGQAVSPLTPSGAVEVNGVRLDARSEGLPIEAGAAVVVLRGDPTGYVVRVHVPGSPPLPNHGQPIRKADFAMNSADVAEEERKERLEHRQWLFRMMRLLALFAGLVGVATGYWMHHAGYEPGIIAAWSAGVALAFAVLLAGIVWAVSTVM